METVLVNNDFSRSVTQLRRILPKLSFGLLIVTYLISALIMGMFHARDSKGMTFTIAAFAVPLAIQAGRGALVFFFQLNPSQVQCKISFGVIAATLMLFLSLCEAFFVMWPFGVPWTVSVSTLMIIGWIIEIMILKETQFSTQMELYSNPDQLKKLKEFYLAKQDFEQFLKNMDSVLEKDQTSVEKEPEKNTNPNTNQELELELGKGLSPFPMNGR